MKVTYYKLFKYLPRKNFDKEPVLYLYDGCRDILFAYCFDSRKKVTLVSEDDKTNFRYMSLYEMMINEWEIIKDYDEYRNSFEKEELPF